MPQPFKMYRIICTLTDKTLVSGSNYPNCAPIGHQRQWWLRGQWSNTAGAFWKSENTVRKHLQNLCHDWMSKSAPSRWPRYANQRDYWMEAIPGAADWSRLAHLRVEQIHVTNHSAVILPAHDFMGIPEEQVA